tara:strand:+ start:285 stop:494 length:210 start_codon:yes stop_codon:yes gene_type:complete
MPKYIVKVEITETYRVEAEDGIKAGAKVYENPSIESGTKIFQTPYFGMHTDDFHNVSQSAQVTDIEEEV